MNHKKVGYLGYSQLLLTTIPLTSGWRVKVERSLPSKRKVSGNTKIDLNTLSLKDSIRNLILDSFSAEALQELRKDQDKLMQTFATERVREPLKE